MKVKIIGLPKTQTGGKPVILNLPPDTVLPLKIKDTRKIDKVTGKKINSKNDFSKDIDYETTKKIITEAKKQGIDPYTALAISYQETGINKEHPFDLNPDQYKSNFGDPNLGVKSIVSQMQYAKQMQKKGVVPNTEDFLIQGYNGYGKIKRGHRDLEGSTSIYGYNIPSEGLDFKKNPLYGKRVLDIRDNILKTNPEIQKLVNDSKQTFKFGGENMRIKIIGAPKHQAGGQVNTVKGLPDRLHHMANVEAEAGEVYQARNGAINKISDSDPSHEQGGSFVPDVERVLEDTSMDRKDKASKTLKMSPDEVHTIFGVKPKRPLSHAKAYEFVKSEYAKDTDRYNKNQKILNDKPNFDKIKNNTAKLNFINREEIPTDQDVFDTLFEHQEAIKAVHDIQNDGKTNKYGGYKPKAAYGYDNSGMTPDDLGNGPKSKTKKGQTTTEGKNVDTGGDLTLDEFKDLWKERGLNLDSYKTNKEAQAAVYDYIGNKDPEQLRQMWKSTGLTNLGRQNASKLKALGIELAPNPRDPYHRLDVKDWDKLTPDQLKSLNNLAYADDNFHIRTLVPQGPGRAKPLKLASIDRKYNDPAGEFGNLNVNSPTSGSTIRNSVNNRFFEPTNWYDLAPGIAELEDSFTRYPELYNPVDIHTLRLQQLNPEAALRANQGDYNAALQALGNEHLGAGARSANISNLTAEKYKANNQIIGEYTNQNANIKNREIEYNTQAQDRQSMADASSRQKYYADVLQSRDNQRLQRLQAIQDLSRVQQLKARQNSSGNLILKMSPHFDQQGNYNGNPAQFTLPLDMNDGSFIPQQQGKQTIRQTIKVGNKTYNVTDVNPQ